MYGCRECDYDVCLPRINDDVKCPECNDKLVLNTIRRVEKRASISEDNICGNTNKKFHSLGNWLGMYWTCRNRNDHESCNICRDCCLSARQRAVTSASEKPVPRGSTTGPSSKHAETPRRLTPKELTIRRRKGFTVVYNFKKA